MLVRVRVAALASVMTDYKTENKYLAVSRDKKHGHAMRARLAFWVVCHARERQITKRANKNVSNSLSLTTLLIISAELNI